MMPFKFYKNEKGKNSDFYTFVWLVGWLKENTIPNNTLKLCVGS